MPTIPAASTMCGGLRIFTSRPYALCHQSSNGAEVIIMIVPQMQTQAPSGAWKNRQNRTEVPRDSAVPANVVRRAVYPQLRPATIAAICSRMCGGDQNVSRPMVRCHEMSHNRPATMHADEKTTA